MEEKGQMYDITLSQQVFDVVVIGGGVGGFIAALRTAHQGGRVAIVEKDKFGGTCLNRGCIPTKTLIKSAELYDSIRKAGEFGLKVKEFEADLPAIIKRKEEVLEQSRGGIARLLEKNGVAVLRGDGSIEGKGLVKVMNQGDEIILKARNIIIATGSRPASPPIPGSDLDGVMNSDEILDMTSLPSSLTIIGGGVIGVEMAWIYSTLGVKINIIELLPRILMPVDEEIAVQTTDLLKEKGVIIYTGTKVQKITKVEGGGLAVATSGANGEDKLFLSEKVLISIGRILNTEGLNLEEAGITTKRGAIEVDSRMMTSVPNIYAIGDITGGMLLAHVASTQGIVAADNITGHPVEMDYSSVPSCIYTIPEIGAVGLTEQQAIEKGYRIKVSRFPFSGITKARLAGEAKGQLKLICNESDEKIIGAHILGPHATEMIAVLTVSMQNGLTAEQVARTIFAHPTASEVIPEAAFGILGRPIHS